MLVFIVIVCVKLFFASFSSNGGITVTRKVRKHENLIFISIFKKCNIQNLGQILEMSVSVWFWDMKRCHFPITMFNICSVS